MTTARRQPLSQDYVRQLALSLPETYEASHQGTPDLRVRDKIFATLPPDGGAVVLKSTPANLSALVYGDPATFRDVWAERWVSVDLARVDPVLLDKLLIDAWCLAAPKALAQTHRTGGGERRP